MNTEWMSHFKAAAKELLLALRSLIETGIEGLEKRTEENEEKKRE